MSQQSNQTSIAGEFAVLSQLALRGFDANLTLGNTKGVDILVSDPKTKNFARIEVKTTRYKERTESLFGKGKFVDWTLSAKNEEVPYEHMFYCFVAITEDTKFRYFIVPAEVVAKYAHDEHRYWLSQRNKEFNEGNKMRRFRMGVEDQSQYNIPTCLIKDHEDHWELIRS